MRLHKKSAGKCWPAVWFLGLLMQPFSFLEFDMTPLDYLIAIGGSICLIGVAGLFIAACVAGDLPTEEDDAEQLRAIQPDYSLSKRIERANKQVRTRIRLGRSWRNLFGLWSN
jgi:hypothetical protein